MFIKAWVVAKDKVFQLYHLKRHSVDRNSNNNKEGKKQAPYAIDRQAMGKRKKNAERKTFFLL